VARILIAINPRIVIAFPPRGGCLRISLKFAAAALTYLNVSSADAYSLRLAFPTFGGAQ
jgi:hypothetical protein